MTKVIVICIWFFFASQAVASDSVSECLSRKGCIESELSHVVEGLIISGAATAIADRYWPEHRALIGFAVGASAGFIGEFAQDWAGNGKFSLMDAVSTAIGAAIGTLITDRFILMPVVKQQSGNSYIGVVTQLRF